MPSAIEGTLKRQRDLDWYPDLELFLAKRQRVIGPEHSESRPHQVHDRRVIHLKQAEEKEQAGLESVASERDVLLAEVEHRALLVSHTIILSSSC